MQKITIGQISKASGLVGAVKVSLYSATIEQLQSIQQFYINDKPYGICKPIRPQGRQFVFQFESITDRTMAESLTGQNLAVLRDDLPELPEGSFYQIDLIGKIIKDQSGHEIGAVEGFDNFGAGQLITIKLKNTHEEVMLPFNDQ